MKKDIVTIINSENYWRLDNFIEGESEFGSYREMSNLRDELIRVYESNGHEDADCEISVEYDDDFWQSQKEQFEETIDELIQKYEKRYKATVEYIALAGTVGRWNGEYIGGKIVSDSSEILETFTNCDDITVQTNEDGVIELIGYHHDGRHTMNLYFISYSRAEKMRIDTDYENFAAIVGKLKPIKF